MDFPQFWFKFTERLQTDYCCCLKFHQWNPSDYYCEARQLSDVLSSHTHIRMQRVLVWFGLDGIICASANSEPIPSEGPLMCPTFCAGHDSPCRDGAHVRLESVTLESPVKSFVVLCGVNEA